MPKSYHILLTTFGSYGDLHPYMALARALIALGHHATIGTSLTYRDKILSAGIDFAHVRPDIPQGPDGQAVVKRAMHPRTGTATVIREIVLSGLRDAYVDTGRAVEGCNAIVSHALTYASPIIAEERRIPWIFTALQPAIFFSAIDPAVPPATPWAIALRSFGPRFYSYLMRVGMAGIESWAEPIHRLRRDAGLPAAKRNPITFGQFSPHLNLALFSKSFAAPVSDWPDRTVQTGFCFYDDYDTSQPPMAAALREFLERGDPPIVFTLGSAAVCDPGHFYHDSAAAARLLHMRGVLLTGASTGNEDGLDLGDGTVAFDYAPYGEIFPRAAAIIHQGGIGTTAQALRSGRPMAIMPFAHDQFDNARRCKSLGVSRTLSRARYSAGAAARAVRSLTRSTDSVDRAASLAEALNREQGARTAAELIVSLLRS